MKKRRSSRLLLIAAALLACVAVRVLWTSREVRERREVALAGVPSFPQPGQQPVRKSTANHTPPIKPLVKPRTQPAPHDNMLSFVHGAGGSVALVHVNALLNTPLFDRLRQCMPKEFAQLEGNGGGLNFSRDIDQLAMVPGGGMVMSGFFEGKPIAEQMLKNATASDQYRGATILTHNNDCTAQLGNLIVESPAGNCKDLVDRALAPTTDDAQNEVYGDVYMRTDLSALRADGTPPELRTLVDGLSGMTVRANVWDSVALTVEGAPLSGKDANELAQIARGAVTLVKSQLNDDQVELQALAELAKVSTDSGKLELTLALPASDLFDRFHFPCPGLADAGR
jgi:hypothetical protein